MELHSLTAVAALLSIFPSLYPFYNTLLGSQHLVPLQVKLLVLKVSTLVFEEPYPFCGQLFQAHFLHLGYIG